MKAQPPRVLHVAYALDFGGVETHLRVIAEAEGKSFDHQFCALSQGGAAAEGIRAAGGRVHELGKNAWRQPISTVLAVRALCRRLRIKVIHCHGADANLFGLIGAWLAGTPVRVGEEVAVRPHRLAARLACRFAYAQADRVIAVSDAVANHLHELREAPRSKVVRLYNPVALSERRTSPRAARQKLRIGFVGRLAPEKNPRALLEATALLRNTADCELVMIGDGVQRAELEALVESLELQDLVSLPGFVPEPDRLLATCHLYVQPSLHEGMCIALVEAMSCGLPPIVSAAGGMPEIVEHGVNGWLLDSSDPRGVAEAVNRALALPPAELAEFGARARSSVENRFDRAAYVKQLEAIYDDCLTGVGWRAPS